MKVALVYLMCMTHTYDPGGDKKILISPACVASVGKMFKTLKDCEKESNSLTEIVDVKNRIVTVEKYRKPQACIEIEEKSVSKKQYKMVEK